MPDVESGTVPVITIDGPGGSGKGTVSMRLAEDLGWHILDSGALYRIVAVAALEHGVEADDEKRLAELASKLDVEFMHCDNARRVLLEGRDITSQLRLEEVGTLASEVAAIPAVRAALIERQRRFRQPAGLVADGRGMGTVIFPDAKLKIFLTASVEERANRRYKQLKEKGESVNLSRLFRDIEKRDKRDSTRTIAPLKPATDAHLVDSTDLSIDQVMEVIHNLLKKI